MNNQSKRELAQDVFRAMNSKNFDILDTILDENAVFDFPGSDRIEGKKRVILFLKALLRKFPKLNFTVQDIIVEENKICVVWENIGERINGDFYKNRGVTYFIVQSNLLVFMSDYFKDTSFVN